MCQVQGICGQWTNVVEAAADMLRLLGHNMPPVGGEGVTAPYTRHAELVSASISPLRALACGARWTLKQVQGDVERAGV